MKRILLVLGPSTGGIGQHVHSLAQGLSRRGCQVLVAGPAETNERFGFSLTGARFVRLSVSDRPNELWSARLGRLARAADVVHAHGFRAGLVAVTSTRGKRKPPVVVSWHNQVLATGLSGRAQHLLERVVARRATLTLCASNDLVERARELGADARFVPVAAPRLSESTRAPDLVRSALGVGPGPLLLAVGRLHKQKDFPTMFEAMGLLADRPLSPTLVVAGDGPLRQELSELAARSAVPIRLLGHRDDIADLLAVADMFLLSSVWEARALVLQEAMRAGVPVVATRVGGIPDLVGDDALVVPAGDAGAFAWAVDRLIDDPTAAASLAVAGQRRAAAWPDEEQVVELIEQVYDELLEERA